MPSIEDQINADADQYQDLIHSKFKKFNDGKAVPVKKDVGDDYIRGYRKHNGSPFVIQLSRQAIAYLYRKLYEETVGMGTAMDGDLAVSFAKRDPGELPNPGDPRLSDPNWDPRKAYLDTVMLGFWDKENENQGRGVGIKPFKANVGGVSIEYYDDWNQEWP